MNNNVFEDINKTVDINRLVSAYGFKPDRQNNIPCFIHNDHEPSLHLHTETNTWWCYVCGEGSSPIDFVMKLKGISVLEAAKDINEVLNLGIDFEKKFDAKKEKKKKEAEYFYRKLDGSITMKVEKYIMESTKKKEFYPYALIDGEYKKGYKDWLKHEDCVLYNLPEIINSNIVYFTEGEKDADTLKHLGYAGTTTPGGGRGFKSYYQKNPEMFSCLKDKEIRIISDNDDVGNEYIKQILEVIVKETKKIKIFNLCNVMPKLKKKGDITDVYMAMGREKTLELIKRLEEETEEYKKIEEIEEKEIEEVWEHVETVQDALNIKTMERLYFYELNTERIEDFMRLKAEIVSVCKKEGMARIFEQSYKKYKEGQESQYIYDSNFITFDGLLEYGAKGTFATNKYEMSPEGVIYEVVPNIGKILVCYHPIVPVNRVKNIDYGTEKIKLAYYIDNEWKFIIVDKSVISTTQSIVKLSNLGINVNSENAKYLIKYFAEIENLNRNMIAKEETVSKLGWINNELVPYCEKYNFDNEEELPEAQKKFDTLGTVEEWANFYRERRKYNDISRIVMGGAVSSILLKKIRASGFTIHVWGESEFGKSVVCMIGQSIFGKPTSSDTEANGIGINFNFTEAGLETRLNLYNNIPLFINEMQLKKDEKDYDKILFMVETGQGKSRSTKAGLIGQNTTWNNVAITNGEKNIVKQNSDNGAYNRCLSCELTKYSFEDLHESVEFCKEHYGTAIREILKKLKDYDLSAIYEKKLEEVEKLGEEVSKKQKRIIATIMTGDKVLTDIIFKDEYYLTVENFENKIVNKKEIAIEERAYEITKDWYVTKKRCFIDANVDEKDDKNVDIYGKNLNNRIDGECVAFLVEPLRKLLYDNGFDFEQVTKSWARKGFSVCDRDKNQKNVRIFKNSPPVKCVVLKLDLGSEIEIQEEKEEMPF